MTMDDKKEVLHNKIEKKRIQTEIEHLGKAYKSGIMPKSEYISAKNSLDKKIKDMDRKLRQAEAKEKAVEEILGAESILTVPKKKHQKDFIKIDKTDHAEQHSENKPVIEEHVEKSVITEKHEKIIEPQTIVTVQNDPPFHEIEDVSEDTNWRFALAILTIFLVILLYIKFTSYGNAPDVLAIDAYLDYSSQYSKEMHGVLVQLTSEYGSGLLVQYHLIGVSEQSQQAAHAVFCAAQQDREQEYFDYLFTQENADMFSVASSLGLETDTFDLCMNAIFEPETTDIQYTPTLSINNKKIVGAVGYDAVKAVIDQEMTALG
jgi:hypothetical protein